MLISAEKGLKIFQKFWKSPFFGQISDMCAKKWPSTAQTENDTKKCIKPKMSETMIWEKSENFRMLNWTVSE